MMVMGGSMLSERLQKMAKLKMYRMIFKSFCKFYKTNSDSSQMPLADPTNTVSKHIKVFTPFTFTSLLSMHLWTPLSLSNSKHVPFQPPVFNFR